MSQLRVGSGRNGAGPGSGTGSGPGGSGVGMGLGLSGPGWPGWVGSGLKGSGPGSGGNGSGSCTGGMVMKLPLSRLAGTPLRDQDTPARHQRSLTSCRNFPNALSIPAVSEF